MIKAVIPTLRNVFLSIQQNLTEEQRQEKIVCVEGKINVSVGNMYLWGTSETNVNLDQTIQGHSS